MSSDPDLELIVRGGEAFEQRLRQFRALAAQAEEAQTLHKEAVAARNEAFALLGHAERQIQKNRRAAEELAKAQAAAEAAKSKFERKYGNMLKAAR